MNRRDFCMASGLAAMMSALAPFLPLAHAGTQPAPQTAMPGRRPIVIAHRGASGYLPEHSASAYQLAIIQGADYIEPDLVMTRDGVLVARHENEIGRSTNVADHPEFASRRVSRTIDGENFTGWFAEDFTLAELKTMRTRERNPDRRPLSARHSNEEPVLTLQEIIDIARTGSAMRSRPVGIYIELKNPDYHRSIGLNMEKALVETLERNGLNKADAPVFIESFWPSALIALARMSPVRRTFLINSVPPPEAILKANGIARWSDVYSAEGMRKIAGFAHVVAPETKLVLQDDPATGGVKPTRFVETAHAAGLPVHLWSISAENSELPTPYRRGDPAAPGYGAMHGDATGLARTLFGLGVDGIFTDYPDMVIAALPADRR